MTLYISRVHRHCVPGVRPRAPHPGEVSLRCPASGSTVAPRRSTQNSFHSDVVKEASCEFWLCAHAWTPSCTVRSSHGCVLDAWGLLASLGCSRSTHIYTQSASKLCCTDCRVRCSYCVFMPLSLVVLYGTFMHVACAACAPFRPAGVHTACCAVLHCTLMHGTKLVHSRHREALPVSLLGHRLCAGPVCVALGTKETCRNPHTLLDPSRLQPSAACTH